MSSSLNRVCICFASEVEFKTVFGPFPDLVEAVKFRDKHEEICRFPHVISKLTDPKFGVFNKA